MQIIRDIAELRGCVAGWRRAGDTVALVPTMGALHPGHMALVAAAAARASRVVVSIFVNPTQFGPAEDFSAYPRREVADAALLRDAGTALLWAPDVAAVYPEGHRTHVHVGELGDNYCGAARPGHFDGVATVVAKLLNQVAPDVALFGEKDWQQLAIIRRMAHDLNFPVQIVGVPIVREADGLARSSRNQYLTPEQRAQAAAFPAALAAAAAAMASGGAAPAALAACRAAIIAAGFDRVDYVELVDGLRLTRLDRAQAGARILAAARIGTTRLIDNMPIFPD